MFIVDVCRNNNNYRVNNKILYFQHPEPDKVKHVLFLEIMFTIYSSKIWYSTFKG